MLHDNNCKNRELADKTIATPLPTKNCRWGIVNGRLRMMNGRWEIMNGFWGMVNGRWGDPALSLGNGDLSLGNQKRIMEPCIKVVHSWNHRLRNDL